jgi:uncharacterized protein YjiS (DUF1127 family)
MVRLVRHQSASLQLTVTDADPRRFQRGSIDRLGAILWTWQQRMIQRIDLADLDDHLVADIGLTHGQVAREASKPFWRP